MAVAVAWIAAARGGAWPRSVELSLVALVVLATVAWGGVRVRAWWRQADSGDRWTALGVAILALTAIAIRVGGIGWELGGGALRDESYYVRLARRVVDDGGLFPRAFHYGHLVYYIGAFSLWLIDLMPGLDRWLMTPIVGSGFDDAAIDWAVLRTVAATLGGLSVIPVAVAAHRLAGATAALAASAVLTFSTLHARVARQFIAEGPSAFFAACCFAVVAALLVDLERARGWRGWLLAGAMSGLAAACKYPAGVVASAIVGAWVLQVLRTRRWSWGLFVAGIGSIGALLAAMPAFFVHWRDAFAGEGKDLFFGVRQYAKGGWLGVQPESLGQWYAWRVVEDFGWLAVLLTILGWALVPREGWRMLWGAWAWPVVHFGLLASMSMAVERTLTALLPGLAVMAGVGVGSLADRAESGIETPERRRLAQGAFALVAALALLAPSRQVLGELATLLRPSTRELCEQWIEASYPPGTKIFAEWYGPKLDPNRYDVTVDRYVTRKSNAEILAEGYELVILSESAYGRFFTGELDKPHHRDMAEHYRQLLALEPLWSVDPGDGRHQGPQIVVLDARRLPP